MEYRHINYYIIFSRLDAVVLCWKPTRPRCIANSPWSVEALKEKRLTLSKDGLKEQKITVIIDERDRKKGKKTDYVARQYLESMGKIDNGIVSVNAYGI